MDSEKIRMEVFRRTGKSIDLDDPFFVAVEMLAATTDDMERRHVSMLTEMRKENASWRETGTKIGQLVNTFKNVGSKSAASENCLEDFESQMKILKSMEMQATRWLTRANKKLDSFVPILITVSSCGGFVGGLVVAFLKH